MNTQHDDEHDDGGAGDDAARRARQPRCSTRLASSGRNTSWPVALAADSAPSTRPRRSSNQRVATIAASTIEVTPVPVPTSTPHSSVSCHWLLHPRGERHRHGEQRQRARG